MEMNLENELSMLEGMNLETNNMNVTMNNQTQMNQNPMMSNVTPQVAPTNVAMNTPQQNNAGVVNQASVATFNYANQAFDINKPVEREKGPIVRLEGEKGKTFRLHILPGTNAALVHIHSDKEKRHSFVCLRDLYGTENEPCCISHGRAQDRYIVPVVVYATANGNNNMLQSNVGELKCLILGYSQMKNLQDTANNAGANLNDGDIIATVDSQQYKSFNFVVRQDSMLNQISNVAELQAIWNRVATPENICKAAANRIITKEEYTTSYSNYDYNKWKDVNTSNTPAPQNYGVSADSYMQYNNAQVQGFGAPYQQPVQQPMQFQNYNNSGTWSPQ